MGEPPKKVDSTTTVKDDEQAAQRIRLGEQAALMLNVDQILTQVTNNKLRDQLKEFVFFTPVKTNNTNHFEITKKITKKREMGLFFKSLPTSILSALVPSIKLYKVFYDFGPYDKKSKELPVFTATYDWRIPFDDSTFEFGNYTSAFPKNIERIFADSSRINGIGIKSFSYDYKGTNPAETNTNISADLEIFFSNAEDLITNTTILQNDTRFIKNPTKANFNFSYSDLVSLSSRTSTGKDGTLEPNLDYFRIKAVIGYADDDESVRTIMDLADAAGYNTFEADEIIVAMKTAKVVLMLTPVSFDINFGEEGSVTLKIQYQAAVENIIGSELTDVFLISTEAQKFIESKKAYEAALSDRDQKISKAKKDNCKDDEKAKEAEKKIIEEDKKNLEKLENDSAVARRNLYNSLYRALIGIEPLLVSTGMYSVEVQRIAIGLNDSGEVLEQGDANRIASLDQARKIRNVVKLSLDEVERLKSYQLAKEKDTGVMWIGGDKDANATSQKTNDTATKDATKASATDNGFNKIKFVFLGELLDAAFLCTTKITPANDIPRFLIGGMTINIPIGNTLPTKNLKEYFINLCDIPISFNLFQQFLLDKIIKPQRDSYPLLLFIKDIISDLIVPSISPNAFGEDASANTSVRYSMLVLTCPMTPQGTDPLLNRPYKTTFFPPLTDKDIVSVGKGIDQKLNAADPDSYMANGTINYIYLYCSSQFDSKIYKGSEDEDEKNGIFHFKLGADKGIIKKISFSKTNNPFLREMLVRTEGRNNRYITQLYDANVTMFGNNIYRPGDIIYIDPTYMFPGKSTNIGGGEIDLQEALGLGGYYQVITVNTSIADMNYETNMKCTIVALKNGRESKPVGSNC